MAGEAVSVAETDKLAFPGREAPVYNAGKSRDLRARANRLA